MVWCARAWQLCFGPQSTREDPVRACLRNDDASGNEKYARSAAVRPPVRTRVRMHVVPLAISARP